MTHPALPAGVFNGAQFALASSFSVGEKAKLRTLLKIGGGSQAYILTKKTAFLVAPDAELLASYSSSLQSAAKYGIPVVKPAFLEACIAAGSIVDPTKYFLTPPQSRSVVVAKNTGEVAPQRPAVDTSGPVKTWSWLDKELPYKDELYEIIKHDGLVQGLDLFQLELHAFPRIEQLFRIYTCDQKGAQLERKASYYVRFADAEAGYQRVYSEHQQRNNSAKAHLTHPSSRDKILSYGERNASAVSRLVDMIYAEAHSNVLSTFKRQDHTLQDVQAARAVLSRLLQLARTPSSPPKEEIGALVNEYYSLLPHRDDSARLVVTIEAIQEEDRLCQTLEDLLGVAELAGGGGDSSLRYAALGAQIDALAPDSQEWTAVQDLIESTTTPAAGFRLLKIFEVHRQIESDRFSYDLRNRRLLFHGSRLSNWVGILSRGLLIPKLGAESFGRRTDAGMLGTGLYFASSASTSARYSSPSPDGRRLMLVADVALGACKDYLEVATDLTEAPTGYQSVRGIPSTEARPGDFQDEEFVIYNTEQYRIRHLVEFTLDGESAASAPAVASSPSPAAPFVGLAKNRPAPLLPPSIPSLPAAAPSVAPPIASTQKPGLAGPDGLPLPLLSVTARAKVIDLVAEIVLFQEYRNGGSSPIEAKYVFPLDEMSSVCGFEAFIGGKHLVGECKRKEQAHVEYKAAVARGDGAYLMDKEEKEDVFSVSIGNLPPQQTCVMKITYVTELAMDGDEIRLVLPTGLPSSLADAALKKPTQHATRSLHVTSSAASSCPLAIELSVEMAYAITKLSSPSHRLRIKRTDTTASIALASPGATQDVDFVLQIAVDRPHEPRMWVEKSAEGHSCALLAFYPRFEDSPDSSDSHPSSSYISFVVDRSNSMRGLPLDLAKAVLSRCLRLLPDGAQWNVFGFASYCHSLFPSFVARNMPPAQREAEEYVASLSADGGSSDLWTVLRMVLSCAAHKGLVRHSVVLLTDGLVANVEQLQSLVHRHAASSRVLVFGLGANAKKHTIRTLARVGAGAAEFIEKKNAALERAVQRQMLRASQESLSMVAVRWRQYDHDAKPPVQSPAVISSVFRGDRLVVYGFVENCSAAVLEARQGGNELSVAVSTSDLQHTKGLLLHRLAARSMINEWETGVYHSDWLQHEEVKQRKKADLTQLSLDYAILSPWTSFVAVEERSGQAKQPAEETRLRDLVAAVSVDQLSYMGWQPLAEPEPEAPLSDDTDTELREAFKLFDKDGDGRVTVADMKSVMASLGEMMSEADYASMGLADGQAMTVDTWLKAARQEAPSPEAAKVSHKNKGKGGQSRGRGKTGSEDKEEQERVHEPPTGEASHIRNLRIREETAKYLRNLDPDSAFYDPKSRSMHESAGEQDAPAQHATQGEQKAAPKASVQLDVSGWDDVGPDALLEHIRGLNIPGVDWGASKVVPVGYGTRKLQIAAQVADGVSIDDVQEQLQAGDLIQRADVFSFNSLSASSRPAAAGATPPRPPPPPLAEPELPRPSHDEELIREREKSIRDIEKSVTEVNQLFRDVAQITASQSVLLDNIEDNIQGAADSVGAGAAELGNADQEQRIKLIDRATGSSSASTGKDRAASQDRPVYASRHFDQAAAPAEYVVVAAPRHTNSHVPAPAKPAFYAASAPASYLPGLGRGAGGFKTRSDTDPAVLDGKPAQLSPAPQPAFGAAAARQDKSAALFGQLNDTESITRGLRKVSNESKTKNRQAPAPATKPLPVLLPRAPTVQAVNELADYDSGSSSGSDSAAGEGPRGSSAQDSYTSIHMSGFREFLLAPPLLRALAAMEMDFPSKVQHEAVPQAMIGSDLLCSAKHGMGKTAVYIIAILQQSAWSSTSTGLAIVLCHSPEMVWQVADEFEKFAKYMPGTRVATACEGTAEERSQASGAQILVGLPGQVSAFVQDRAISLLDVQQLVVDECEALEGEHSRVQQLCQAIRTQGSKLQVLLFTSVWIAFSPAWASITRNPVTISGLRIEADRCHLGLQHHYVLLDAEQERTRRLVSLLAEIPSTVGSQIIVFVRSGQRGDDLVELLQLNGVSVCCLHEGMGLQTRRQVFSDFRQRRSLVLVCTDLCARGIDIGGVGCVVNYDAPSSTSLYLHRASRAARFGTRGHVVSLLADSEQALLTAWGSSLPVGRAIKLHQRGTLNESQGF